jgi:uridine kinase
MELPADLLEKIKAVRRKHKTLLIGVDGVGGAGKTTLSQQLKENFPETTIVQLDDFYSPKLGRADRERVLEEVFLPLEKDSPAQYKVFDWKTNTMKEADPVHPGGIVVVEGVSALHTDFSDKYGFRIWIDCPPDVGFKRGVERDKIRDGVDNTDQWLNIWMPQEKEYVESQNPRQRADYILKGA